MKTISIYLVLLHFSLLANCTPVPDYIFDVSVPSPLNATNHGSPDIFCVVPSPWFGVMLFYLGNYAAHAATLITYPGEDPIYVGAAILYALFFPTTGIVRGLNAIFRRARVRGKFPFVEDSELRVAARAGALCMIVRTEKWRPKISPTDHIIQLAPTQQEPDATTRANARPDPAPVQGQPLSNTTPSGLPIWRIIEGYWCKELPRLWPYFDTSLERPEPYKYEREGLSVRESLWKGITRMERKIHGTVVLPGNGHDRDQE
jgi:hypothetical protein